MYKAKFITICKPEECAKYYPIKACSAFEGKIFDLEELDYNIDHDFSAPPIHPNCRCALESVID